MRVDYIEHNNGTSSDHEFKEDMNEILNIIDYIFTEIEFKKRSSLGTKSMILIALLIFNSYSFHSISTQTRVSKCI